MDKRDRPGRKPDNPVVHRKVRKTVKQPVPKSHPALELGLSAWRKRTFWFATVVLVPLLLLCCMELFLRLAGYGYSTDFLVKGDGGYTVNESFSRQFYAQDIPGSKSYPLWVPAQK